MNKYLPRNLFGFLRSEYILYITFSCLLACCKGNSKLSSEVSETELFLREVNSFSNISVIPVYVSGDQSDGHYEKTIDRAADDSVNYKSQDVFVKIFGDEQNAESNKIISFEVWSKSLAEKIRSKTELIGMSAEERAEYIERMAIKSNLMIDNKKIIISENVNSNSWICLVDENGKITGRVWNPDLDMTKQFVGEATGGILDGTQLSSILADKRIFH